MTYILRTYLYSVRRAFVCVYVYKYFAIDLTYRYESYGNVSHPVRPECRPSVRRFSRRETDDDGREHLRREICRDLCSREATPSAVRPERVRCRRTSDSLSNRARLQRGRSRRRPCITSADDIRRRPDQEKR